MSLNIGIVGLPNVGKSTIFNALTGAQNAAVANYPFCTIQPNRAIVPLPDERLDHLGQLVHAPQVIHATIEFVDIAGLVRGAHQGEGLGNQFLGQIRDVNAILHIVRCFDDPNVVHVSETPDPVDDIETIQVELALADLEQLDRKIDRLTSALKADKKLQPLYELSLELKDHLAQGKTAASFPKADHDCYDELNRELRFLTAKPMIYVANVDEDGLASGNQRVDMLKQLASQQGNQVLVICAALEQDMLEMSAEERSEYLELAGIQASGLEQVIRASFDMLDLISFFTFNEKEARSWNIIRGSTAPKAAGTIHTDFERGFIRAEVIPYDTFAEYGSSAAVRSVGLMRLEGKEYIVRDGDVIYFRFNV
jgi:GTP-binding protein YchF